MRLVQLLLKAWHGGHVYEGEMPGPIWEFPHITSYKPGYFPEWNIVPEKLEENSFHITYLPWTITILITAFFSYFFFFFFFGVISWFFNVDSCPSYASLTKSFCSPSCPRWYSQYSKGSESTCASVPRRQWNPVPHTTVLTHWVGHMGVHGCLAQGFCCCNKTPWPESKLGRKEFI